MKRPSVLGALIAAVVCVSAFGQATSTNSISLQAKLTGVPDGTASLAVKFYDALTGGTQVGSTITLTAVPVQGGIVSVPVSPVDATIFNGSTRYMEISVNGGAALSPRTLVTSVPYSLCLVGSSNPTLVNALGNLRTTGGVQADGSAIGDWSFRGAYVHGTINNWSGPPANLLKLLGSDGVTGGYALARTAGVVSPIVFINDEPGNAFEVRAAVPGTDLATESRLLFGISRLADGTGQMQIGTSTVGSTLTVFGNTTINGNAQVRVLTITGADVAEPFNVAKSDAAREPTPGMVVSIDPANPGKLIVCSTPYDKKVAGAISGAGGLSVGVVMGKDNADPLIKGNHPVAMSGRVYVWCDASSGAIEPGDLLTTSATPGHAMKAADQSKAFGAVIGKAMTELKDGKGLVLVLVNLQ